MKREIMELVNSSNGVLKISSVAELVRFHEERFGLMSDYISLKFLPLNGVEYGFQKEIVSREYDGIIKECALATEEFFKIVSEQKVKELRAGYVG